jgi:hypothetical protein
LRLDPGPPARFDPVPIVTYRATVKLEIFRADGEPEVVEFRFDTGAGIPQMSLRKAQGLGLKIAGRRGHMEVTTAAGTRWEDVIAGSIRARFPTTDRVFLWECLFFVDRAEEIPPLLGLRDVFQSVRLSFDKSKTPHHPYGCLVVEEYLQTPDPASAGTPSPAEEEKGPG